jgi:hypothetical protein
VLNLISWKYSFKRLNEEYEIAKKKKHALDSLFETGRISQATRDSFNSELTEAIAEIEKQQQDLLEKMQGKTNELEEQVKTLETLLANYEIQHVVGEIDEEIYQREINLLNTGLETAKRELGTIKEAANQLCPSAEAPAAPEPPAAPQENQPAQDQPAENVTENVPEAPIEMEVTPESATVEPCPQEPVITEEAPAPEPTVTEQQVTEPQAEVCAENAPPETVSTEMPAEAPTESIEMPTEETTASAETPPTEEPQIEAAQPVEDTPQVIEDQPPIIEEQPQIVEEQPIIETPNTEEIPQEEMANVEEITPTEEMPQVEEVAEEAHPHEAPKEAHPEIVVEPITETESAEEAPAAEAETENAENQEET